MTITQSPTESSETQSKEKKFGKVITDTGSDVPQVLCDQFNIGMASLRITFGDKDLFDRRQITNAEFYRRLRAESAHPKTGAVDPEEWRVQIQNALDEGHPFVVCVTLAENIPSKTYENAVKAQSQFPEGQVFVVDSKSVSMGEGLLAIYAAKLAKLGKSGEAIVGAVEKVRDNARVWATFDTLEYLDKGGRMGDLGFKLVTRANVKPIVTFTDGRVNMKVPAIGRSAAVVQIGRKPIDDSSDLVVCHADVADEAKKLVAKLQRRFPNRAVFDVELGPTMGTHGGPGTLGTANIDGLEPLGIAL